ncbi:MAG: bifunctional (p)ppGpp synthetase/guanosine-3',5'-bis(diphosphate) 3'-pyrophosphohydrolase [Bryobacterales bacterium]|nr:bifunctional (p)ppGpp synthetase/guanosine-3',5'-bis(diphosphate) 3'-pyrophosphohydrolase [Bryobacterales bacterium]
MDSALIFHAIQFASAAHAGQYRKNTRVPYLIHPLRVSKILVEAGCSEHLAVAAVLHDTVEDCFVTYEQIRRLFGDEVAELVRGATEPDKSDTWENRKRNTIEFLGTAGADMLLVSVADKLDNIRSIREDLELHGDLAWTRFKRGRESQAWYFRSLAEVFNARMTAMPGKRLAEVFAAEVEQVFPQAAAAVS